MPLWFCDANITLLFSISVDCLGNFLTVQEICNDVFFSCRFSFLCCLLLLQIKVSNSALISAFMTELEADTPMTQVIFHLFSGDLILISVSW